MGSLVVLCFEKSVLIRGGCVVNERERGIQIIDDLAQKFLLDTEESSALCRLLLLVTLHQEGTECEEYQREKVNLLQGGDFDFREALFEFESRLSKEVPESI